MISRIDNLRHPARPRSAADRRIASGFTLVEMLVTTAIIVVLLTILVVALSQAARVSQRSNTTFLMGTIKQGLERFRADTGYLPPVLDRSRNVAALPDPTAGSYADDVQAWGSETSLAEYLLGYGDRSQDGYGFVGDPSTIQFPGAPGSGELPTLGFRNPGSDGAWGAIVNPRTGFPPQGLLAGRNPGNANVPFGPSQSGNNDLLEGRVYGPYIDLSDPSILGSIDPGTGVVSLPGEAGYTQDDPRVFVDYWGEPLRYYRRLHFFGDPANLDTRLVPATDRTSNLGDVFALRPSEIPVGQDADGIADGAGDTSTTRILQSAELAIFSPGPDRAFSTDRRIDEPDNFNRDNIVEVGP